MNRLIQAMNALVEVAVGRRTEDRTSAIGEQATREPSRSGSPPMPGTRPVKPPMSDREYDVFVSYRRDKGSEVARYLAESLSKRGYRVFLDVDSLGSGEWGKELQDRIDECPDFIAVVTDGYFVRCESSDDVVRREIARAIETRSTVIPLFVGDAKIPAGLPGDISGISAHNGVRYLHDYANQAVEKVCGFLHSTPLLGPERLGTGEVQPRVVLLAVLFTIGVWRGAVLGDNVGYQLSWWVAPLFGLGMGLLAVLVVLLPVLIGLTVYGKTRRIGLDALYAGPWTPFWSIVIPFMFLLTSVFVPIVQGLTGIRSFFLGGLLGGLLAMATTRAIVTTDMWTEVTRALGLASRPRRVS